MTTAVDKWPAAARLVAVAAAGHSDPLLLHHLKGHDQYPTLSAQSAGFGKLDGGAF